MARATKDHPGGARDVARDRRYASPPVREAQLSLRGRRGAPRTGVAQLLVRKPSAIGDASRGADRAGSPGDGALSPGACAPGAAGQRGVGGACSASQAAELSETFSASTVCFGSLVEFLAGTQAAGLTHEQLEDRLDRDGRTLLRQLYQDHLDLRAGREQRIGAVVDADGIVHGTVERGHRRTLETIFGEVVVTRLAYRAKTTKNLHPTDAALNLPLERHSHGLRQRCAIEASRGSYEEATSALDRHTGVELAKRQVEQLAARAAVDFEAFYDTRPRPIATRDDVVIISADGKGVVMRPEGLRPPTAAAAAKSKTKLKGRLSKGEKANRKRMAEVGAVYTVVPVVRSPEDVMAPKTSATKPKNAPKATDKWLTASLVDDAATVIAKIFDEAQRRDPDKHCDWVALVDGNRHQIDRIEKEAVARRIEVTVIVDWVHVLEYLWSAGWSFFTEGDPTAEDWVHDKAIQVLSGKASIVAASIRRKATTLRLDPATRRNADTCADYLLAKAPYLNYPNALAHGWPIATGVIEGACRHIVKDRMDITGARWGLKGAEAVLKLRALRANTDWHDYWTFHLAREHQRIHTSRYTHTTIPAAA